MYALAFCELLQIVYVFLILGIALFTLGADLAMTPMGSSVGSGLAKKRKLGLLLIISFSLSPFLLQIINYFIIFLLSRKAKSFIIRKNVLIDTKCRVN